MGEPAAVQTESEVDPYSANTSEPLGKMSHLTPERGPIRGCGTRRRSSPTLSTPEGDESLQVLHNRGEDRLIFDPLTTPPASAPEPVFVLPFGEEVLATDAELAAYGLASRPMDVSYAVPRFDLLHLLGAGSLALHPERPALPLRHRFRACAATSDPNSSNNATKARVLKSTESP